MGKKLYSPRDKTMMYCLINDFQVYFVRTVSICFGHLMRRADSFGKTGQEEKWMTEDEMVGWHHPLNEHEFEQTVGDSEGQGSPVC